MITGRIVLEGEGPFTKPWTGGRDIRVSLDIKSPATFGSIILLPLAYAEWPQVKRAAVVAHEAAHVRRGDFYVQLAASVNRAIFWFNPLSWWLRRRLSELAEVVSDDEAIDNLQWIVPLYAANPPGNVVRLANSPWRRADGALCHAPHSRIERILADPTAPTPLDKHARAMLIATILSTGCRRGEPIDGEYAGRETRRRDDHGGATELLTCASQSIPSCSTPTLAPTRIWQRIGHHHQSRRRSSFGETHRANRLSPSIHTASMIFFQTVVVEHDALFPDAPGIRDASSSITDTGLATDFGPHYARSVPLSSRRILTAASRKNSRLTRRQKWMATFLQRYVRFLSADIDHIIYRYHA